MFLDCRKGERPSFDHKEMERRRGFLIHLDITFSSIIPFLKGIHLTLDSWRPGRGSDGWKMKDKAWRVYCASVAKEGEIPEALLAEWTKDAPKRVTAAERLEDDAKAIWRLFSSEIPPEVPVRVRSGGNLRFWRCIRNWIRLNHSTRRRDRLPNRRVE